jgi:hypothetical protein
MAAQQRGGATRTIILAHQVAVMQRNANSKAGLKSLESYLKPIERSRKRRRAKADQSDLVAAMLESRATKTKKRKGD